MSGANENDVILVGTTDKPAARAVVVALTKACVPFEQTRSAELANREVVIRVAHQDRDRALDIAGPILARRAKFKSYPQVKPLPEFPGDPDNRLHTGIDLF